MVSIENAKHIQGWMSENELDWLASRASVRSAIVEIGVWHGRTTRALADSTSGTVYAVDTFGGSLGDESMMFHVRNNHEGWVLAQFKANTGDCKNIEIVQMTSVEAAEKFYDKQFDMIFIDGEHTYEAVCADIEAWYPLLSPTGLFCGHDFAFSPVATAVKEHFDKIGSYSNIWYVE